MALPSQMERATTVGRLYSSRRRSLAPRKLIPIAAAIGLVLVGVGAVWGFSRLLASGPSSAGAAPEAPNGSKLEPAKKPAVSNTGKANKPPAPPPVSLSQSSAGEALNNALERQSPQGEPTRPKLQDPSGLVVDTPRELKPQEPKVEPKPEPRPEPRPEYKPAPAEAAPRAGSPSVQAMIDEGDRAVAKNDPVGAREAYSRALLGCESQAALAESLRAKLTSINLDLVFSPKVFAGDPLAETYRVEGGDSLEKIRRKRELASDWRFIQRVNRLANANKISVGQPLKLVRGPFHVVVHKQDYRADLFAGAPDEPETWLYIRSFKVGLGTQNSTPVGTFVVKANSKLVNPFWTNPETGEQFHADNPKNPIGEHWLGLEGTGASAALVSYGLHGTIEPDSIGQQKSMGCVRLHSDDIALIYEMLVEKISTVKIVN